MEGGDLSSVPLEVREVEVVRQCLLVSRKPEQEQGRSGQVNETTLWTQRDTA